MTLLKLPDRRLVETAEAQSTELLRLSRILEDAAWELDSSLSAIRKDAAGYRIRNGANPNGGENYTPGELESASREARTILASCNDLQDLLDRRAEQAARTEAACDPLDDRDPSPQGRPDSRPPLRRGVGIVHETSPNI